MKHRLVLVLALAFVLAVGGMVMAQRQYPDYVPEGNNLPENAQPTTTYVLADGEWVASTNAQSFNSGNANGHCNRECWDFTIENHVSVAQWINWSIDGTRKDWRVLKPGTYASNSVTAQIQSNNDVRVSFWAEDPVYLNDDVDSPVIAKHFGYTVGADNTEINSVVTWVAASDTSEEEPLEFVIAYEQGLADGLAWRIWEQIEVTDAHRSSDYHGFGGVQICVTNLKYWVDESGTFNDLRSPVS